MENSSTASDLIQDLFIKLWEKKSELIKINNIKQYLFTSTKNSCYTYLKLNKKDTNVNIEKIDLDSSINDLVFEEETYNYLLSCINKLSEQSREVMIMALSGDKNPEIAKELNISVHTVHTVKKRAYKQLREILKDKYYLLFLYF